MKENGKDLIVSFQYYKLLNSDLIYTVKNNQFNIKRNDSGRVSW